jgi:hypothetical protein
MAPHSTAQGLASLGRHGDSVLVHMQPQEVAGLQSLARMHGTSLTVNPHTGMPEAFNLGKMFKSLLPMAAGFLLGPAGFGIFSSPLMAGLTVGGLTALSTGNLSQGLMAGLGAGGGFGLGEMFKGAGTQVTESLARDQLAKNALEVSKGAATSTPALTNQLANSGQLSMFTRPDVVGSNLLANQSMANVMNVLPDASAFGQIGNSAGTIAQTGGAANLGTAIPGAVKPAGGFGGTFGQNIGQVGKGIQYAYENPTDFLKMAGSGDMLKGAFNVGLPLAGPVMAGMEPEQPNYDYNDKYKYDPYATLNLNSVDSGLKLVAKGGHIESYNTGGPVDLNPSVGGGLSDLYNRPEGATTQSISADGYGMGRLDKLAQQGSLAKAGDMFYAAGGPVSFAEGGYPYEIARGGYLDGPGDGLSDSIPATIEGKQPARLADGEFVVSSDVVSGLGNGSSKAGAKKLYAMMDRVRQQAHGTKKQIRKVNEKQVMPV